jgi:hypothetical protein
LTGDRAALPAPLGEADVFPLADAGLLEAARDYVLLGRVRRPRRRGAVLIAEVEGTDATYTARAEVRREGGTPRISPACDCPSHRPFCKHVLALLLLWSAEPAAFAPLDDWEATLAACPAPELAALLAEVAMGESDPLELLRTAARPDWQHLPPGRCLEAWDRFRAWAVDEGRWPQAALDLALRIAGPPDRAPLQQGPEAALAARQLAWWLTLAAPELPTPTLQVWLRHLRTRLEAAEAGDPGGLPPELAVWLARLTATLSEEQEAERLWLARLAGAVPALGPAFEAELERLRWEAVLAVRLALGPAAPAAVVEGGAATRAARCLRALAVLRPGDGGESGCAAGS